ncbi:hypothetical protein QTG54_016802 [Skeletonema marinoi]|uniref:Uncharacterized protein n=1 Tax=Skeletonema marinoi TaxID=267567 RepID=A0AAD8XRJ9_9STRA|nr:hypothetical protein QTG54_016802 [Skeletonema marinoi]
MMTSSLRRQVNQPTAAAAAESSNILTAANSSDDGDQIDENDDNSNDMNDEDYFTLFNDDLLEDTIHEEDDEHNMTNMDVQSQQLFQLLNLPPSLHHSPNTDASMTNANAVVGYPVGGMRRVSSCYFSIASNNTNNLVANSNTNGEATTTSAPSSPTNHHHQQHHSLLSSTTPIHILFQHDILMNTFTYLDAQSLASFSETCKRCNFECFYFIELSLQRALLVGDDTSSSNSNNNHPSSLSSSHDNEANSNNNMIAGTGVITRLSRLNNARARQIVQMYLDSNASIRGMPMLHSLSYLRQMIRLHYTNGSNDGGERDGYDDGELSEQQEQDHQSRQQQNQGLSEQEVMQGGENAVQQQQQDGMMISTARNMALLFTFLGAAYKYQHGDVPSMDEETMELCKGMMIKLGVAGGMGSFFKAVKEHQLLQQQQQQGKVDGGGGEVMEREVLQGEGHREIGEGDQEVEMQGVEVNEPNQQNVQQHQQQDGMKVKARNMALFLTLLGAAYKVNAGEIHIDEETMEVAKNMMIKLGLAGSLVKAGQMTIVKKEKGEQSDSDGEEKHEEREGGIEGHNIDGNPTDHDITASDTPRRRNDRSSSMGSIEDLSNMIKHPSAIASRLYNAFQSPNSSTTNLDSVDEQSGGSRSGVGGNGVDPASPRKHRGKRSHFLRVDAPPPLDLEEVGGKSQVEPPTPEAVSYAMDHPFSSNPYDHLSVSEQKKSSNDASAAAAAVSSFLPFKMSHFQPPWAVPEEADSATSPSGCIGAYANAVKSAASEVTRLVKEERKANFEALPEDEQMELGIRFIDACTSDDKIDIVKDILQNQKKMDVDRFFIGQDETETCALHAAAFNGAEKILEFLCGGIDENNSGLDFGLCDVNVTDANGWTALHFAAGANSVLSVRILAEHGAKLTVEAGNGYTPYHWAERLSNEEVASELESLGADNRFVGSWMFGSSSANAGDRRVPFVSYLAQQFFGR